MRPWYAQEQLAARMSNEMRVVRGGCSPSMPQTLAPLHLYVTVALLPSLPSLRRNVTSRVQRDRTLSRPPSGYKGVVRPGDGTVSGRKAVKKIHTCSNMAWPHVDRLNVQVRFVVIASPPPS
ncbi:hypothetical protein MPTK1_6g07980 [Marchantia polymorpha subsp. ruderalis]|uniref:Uncharacterized protein n=2 Tax=Marchantia polymorpha TaxID=3197 RepID=A0AAF6BPQ6_MARPO|nr:hypothetical protein MARPO_0239s0003 [Marchantia polymorpha]BBN13990.1 hypothetical protein Mp_6g07980 [Marchantia polymorpha subsp. ruderalis]|eukprot:PTQ27026.1 hypothetical protein MARPO_0239s0003 [Marchantia polymorpha]